MQSLTFENERGTITVGNSKPYFLQSVDGVSGLTANTERQRSPFQDGSTYIDSRYNNRNIFLRIVITADDYDTLNTRKRTLANIFCARLSTKITYTNGTYTKTIDSYVETTPNFSQPDKTKQSQTAFISLICTQPFWQDETESGKTFSISLGNFIFPLNITEGYEIETEGINRVTINNEGDVETPVLITFEGPATNPTILNETTGEYIKVTKSLFAGEKLIINTEFGNKEVIFDNGSTQTNAFGLIDLNSTFFQLQTGNNVISYSADFGVDTATVNIKYRNRYVGI
jgi:hypothetical protein